MALQVLNLANNRLASKGAIDLLSHSLPNLKKLDLSNNKIGNKAVASLQAYLSSPNCQVSNVNFSNNIIDENGAQVLCQIFSRNPRLNEIDITKNFVDQRVVDQIEKDNFSQWNRKLKLLMDDQQPKSGEY